MLEQGSHTESSPAESPAKQIGCRGYPVDVDRPLQLSLVKMSAKKVSGRSPLTRSYALSQYFVHPEHVDLIDGKDSTESTVTENFLLV